MMIKAPLFQVDAFTDKPFKGNPAAVVLLEENADSGWMQNVAREMNLSETAFVYPKSNSFGLRWFTPKTEVDLCGHATLASAHVLWESGQVPHDQVIKFSTLSGRLSARKTKKNIELDFPANALLPGDLSEEILIAIGGVPEFIGISAEKWLLEFGSEKEIISLSPDFSALRQHTGRGLIVTSRSDKAGVDFVSRYFAPWIGIDEDPVTGSAHTILGPYWSKKLAKNYLTAHQVSERGGVLHLRVSGDRVYIGGQAITIFKGELTC